MDVRLPDGRILRGVPEGTTKVQIAAKLGIASDKQPTAQPAQPEPARDQGFIPEKKSFGDFARTAFDQGMQGATFAFADEISDPLGVALAALVRNPKALLTGEITDPALVEQAATARKTTQNRLTEQQMEMPVTSIASNIGGSLATFGPAAATKTGAAIGNFLRSGNTATKIAKGAGAGAASGYVSGRGAGMDGEKQESANRGAVLGGVVGAAAPAATAALKKVGSGTKDIFKGIFARGEDALDDAALALKDKASKFYGQMRQIGANFTPQSSQRIVQNIKNALAQDGPLNPRLHDKVLAVVDDLETNGFQSLEQLDQWRQVLRDIAGNFTDKVNQRKANVLIDAIDDEISSITPQDLSSGSQEAVNALLQAREFWKRKSQFESIADIVKGANKDANKLKRDLERFRLNKKKTSGLSEEAQEALKKAASQTTGEGVLKLLGKFGFDLGSGRAVGNTALPVIGGMAAGAGTMSLGPAALVPAVGTAARAAHKAISSAKAEELLKVIESGGKVTPSQIMKLPPKEAMALLGYLRTISAPSAVTQTQNSVP